MLWWWSWKRIPLFLVFTCGRKSAGHGEITVVVVVVVVVVKGNNFPKEDKDGSRLCSLGSLSDFC